MDQKYVSRPGLFLRHIPGMTDYAVGAEDTRIKYNRDHVEEDQIKEAVEEEMEKARTQFNSWKAVQNKLQK